MNSKERAAELRTLLTTYQNSYYRDGRSLVSDTQYDKLFDELVDIESKYPELKTEDSPTQRVGSDLSSEFPEVGHTIPVLSLDKAYSATSVLDFVSKTRKANVTNADLSFALEEKIDGFSIVLYYEAGILKRAVTRGNGFVGNDVTQNAKTIKNIPLHLTKNIDIAVRGEIYLPKNDFEKINSHLTEPYANPRNLAAGTIRRNKSSETAVVPLSIFVYEGFWPNGTPFTDHIQILSELKNLGFTVDGNLSYFCKTKEEAERRLYESGLSGNAGSFEDIPDEIERRTAFRSGLPYEIDGLVIKVNELSQRDAMGYTEHHPKWAVAYKFDAPQAQTTVKSIDVQIGRTGRITPMARVDQVKLSGSVIKNVTLHNQDYVNQMELAIGDTVAISKRGDVIPAVEFVVEKNDCGNTTWNMPSLCPVCGSPVVKRGAHHFCTNYECASQVKGRLEFFCSKKQMNIEGLGPKTVEVLYNTGSVNSICDLFKFDYDSLVEQDGFGEKKVQTIKDGLVKAKTVDFARVLQSIGIPEFGKKAIECMIGAGFTSIEDYLNLKETDEARLALIDQIGPVTAHLIVTSFREDGVRKLVEELIKCGLCMKAGSDAGTFSRNGIFSGQTWCITGTFDNFQPREKAIEEIIKRGGKSVDSVSRKTTYLLSGKNGGSKIAKAVEYGVKIIDEKTFIDIISKSEQDYENRENEQPTLF